MEIKHNNCTCYNEDKGCECECLECEHNNCTCNDDCGGCICSCTDCHFNEQMKKD